MAAAFNAAGNMGYYVDRQRRRMPGGMDRGQGWRAAAGRTAAGGGGVIAPVE